MYNLIKPSSSVSSQRSGLFLCDYNITSSNRCSMRIFYKFSTLQMLKVSESPVYSLFRMSKSRRDFSHRSYYYSASSPAFQLFAPTMPSAVSPWLPCQVLVMRSVPLPKMPSAAAPMMICHTFTALPLLPFLIVFML